MDVHHLHTAAEKDQKKKWKYYFWEFLMLFLAVTGGFFAENLREGYIEGSREKALLRTLTEDLRADISQIDSLTQKREIRDQECDSLIHYLKIYPKGSRNALIYLYGRRASRRIHFHPQDIALRQIETAGGFRVIHDEEILNRINNYRLLLAFNNENIQVEEKELFDYSEIAAKIFDVNIFQEIAKCDTICMPSGNPSLLTSDPELLNELCVKLHYWKRTSMTVLESFIKLKEDAETLLSLITKKYH